MRQEIKSFFVEKKNTATLLALTLMIIILPLAMVLIRQQQLYFSRASGESIKIGTGRCVQEKDGKKVLICNEIPLVMAAPFDPNSTPTPSPTSSPTTSPNPSGSASPSPSGSAAATATPAPAANGLISHWKMDEATGNMVADATNANNGTNSSATVIQGKFGSAKSFTAGSKIDVGTSNTLNPTAAMTVSAWVKPGAMTGSKTIIERRLAPNNEGGWVLGIKDAKPAMYIKTTVWVACETTTALGGTSFELVTGTYDGTNMKVYINGVLSKTCPATGAIASPAASTYIGFSSQYGNQNWVGAIDEVMVYNKALTDAQITALMTNTLPTASLSITKTLAGLMSKVSGALIPEVVAYDKHQCAGDTTPGVGGLIATTANGCGEILNYSEILNSCKESATIRYKPPVWNATKREWETIKQDGTIISQASMVERAASDGRFPIAVDSAANPPWINCEVYFEYSGRNDCDVSPQKNAAGLAMGRDGTDLRSGQEFTMDVAKAANPNHAGQPDCKQQVQVELASAATASPIPTASPTPGVTASPTPGVTASPGGQCTTSGTFGSAQMELPNGCGTTSAVIPVGATSGVINYSAPNITSDAVCNLKVLTANNGDCKLDSGGKGSVNSPLKPGESMNINFTNACVDNASGCNLPIVISSAAAIPTDKAAYKLAESETGLTAAPERGFNTQNFTTTYSLVDQKPGLKTIYVQYINKITGEKKTDFATIELIEQNPLIKQVGCQIDIEKNTVNFSLTGLRFGIDGAKATANGAELDVIKHTDTTMQAAIKNAQLAAGDQTYKVKVMRKDNLSSEEVQCRLGVAQISLGAKLFCRGQGKFNLSNVKLVIIDAQGKKIEETTTISNEGVITGLKAKFETGKVYTVSIDAPIILRRNITFTAKEGTTVISKDDGTTLILPVGDIYPITNGGDGTINSLDQAELKRQWRNVESTNTATLTADFNQDKRVNAFDWSCMRKDFGSSDDPVGTAPSGQVTSVEFNSSGSSSSGNGGSNPGTITIEFGVPSPNPNVSAVPGSTPNDSTGVENEAPRRFIQGN